MDDLQAGPIRLLLIEDMTADAERILHQFKRAAVAFEAVRVDTADGLFAALEEFSPAIVLSDFSLPQFDGMSALRICRERRPQLPFVFVSGTIGEERAVAALRAGAADYVLKENLSRLVPAVQRAIGDARDRAERASQDAQIARLNRVLRMLKGVNEVLMRCRDRSELLAETCRVAVSLGGYAMAIAATRQAGGASVKAVASSGIDAAMTDSLRQHLEESAARESSVINTVLRTGKAFIRNEHCDEDGTGWFDSLMVHTGLRACVVLPLFVDGEPSAVLLLTAREPGLLGDEELGMLRDLADSLSFGLQSVQRDTRARFLSHFHPQTGLARRALFCDRVRALVAQAATDMPGHAIAIVDIRRLGAINDSFGRHTGDLLLRRVAEAMKRQLHEQERLAHFSGGTFAMAFNRRDMQGGDWQTFVREQVLQVFAQPFEVEEHRIPLTVRIGCALHPEDSDDPTALVQHAETALQVARAGSESMLRFDPRARLQNVGTLAMEHRLRLALERNEFELHYQPKVNVITRRIQGAEALLRWRSPEDGLVSPAGFLPVLESSELILDVGQWIVRQAASDCAAWKQARLPPVRVAVNISPTQLRQRDFEAHFLAEVLPWASRTWALDVEITEGMLQEDCAAEIKKLAWLRAQGVRIAIDDFGTGYSSLSRLSELPVDTLKIDRRFVGQLVRNPTGAAVVRTVVALARAFNMTSVAEGVERQEELDQLWHVGCDQSQGFLHCMPLPADQFAAVLQHGKGLLMQPPEPEPEDEDEAAQLAQPDAH